MCETANIEIDGILPDLVYDTGSGIKYFQIPAFVTIPTSCSSILETEI